MKGQRLGEGNSRDPPWWYPRHRQCVSREEGYAVAWKASLKANFITQRELSVKGGSPNNDRSSPPASSNEDTKTRPDVCFSQGWTINWGRVRIWTLSPELYIQGYFSVWLLRVYSPWTSCLCITWSLLGKCRISGTNRNLLNQAQRFNRSYSQLVCMSEHDFEHTALQLSWEGILRCFYMPKWKSHGFSLLIKVLHTPVMKFR